MLMRRRLLIKQDAEPYNSSNLLVYLDGASYTNRGTTSMTITNNGSTLTTASYNSKSIKTYSFDGTNDYIQLESKTYNFNTITFSCWMCLSAYNNYGRMWDFQSTSGNSAGMLACSSRTTSALEYHYYGSTSGATYEDKSIITSSGSISLNTWYHVAFTNSSRSLTAYLNASSQGTTTSSYNLTSYAPPNCYIARSNWPNDSYLKGYITDFRIYNYALSSSEISLLYNRGPNK